MNMTTDDKEALFRTYAWSYFALHSGQRMQSFQFFITLATALVGGFAVLVKTNGLSKWYAVIWLLMTLLSFIFWKLDTRTKQLVKNGEGALKHLDQLHDHGAAPNTPPHPLQLFDFDDEQVKNSKMKNHRAVHFSYSRCFNVVFAAFGAIGVFGTVTCILLGVG